MKIKIEKNKKNKKKIETSKFILLVLFIFSTIFVLYNMYLSLITQDTSVMNTVAEGLFKLFGIAVGFYYWKAKNENIRKHNKEIGEEKPEDAGGGDNYYG